MYKIPDLLYHRNGCTNTCTSVLFFLVGNQRNGLIINKTEKKSEQNGQLKTFRPPPSSSNFYGYINSLKYYIYMHDLKSDRYTDF